MSVARMVLSIPTPGSVYNVVDQLPNRGREAEMLQEMGLSSMEDLFSDIPADVRFSGELASRPTIRRRDHQRRPPFARFQHRHGQSPFFLGAGLYRNYVPAAVFQLVTRGEFLTAYTPYQPEVSQGMLQAMWEFQTLVSELVGLPIANLSLYDGSTAAAEALTCAVRAHNRKASQPNTVYVSALTPPDKLSVMHNYCQGAEIEIRTLAHNPDGTLDLDALKEAAGSCGVYLEQPNPLGVLDEGLTTVKSIIGDHTALIVGVQPVLSVSLKPPAITVRTSWWVKDSLGQPGDRRRSAVRYLCLLQTVLATHARPHRRSQHRRRRKGGLLPHAFDP